MANALRRVTVMCITFPQHMDSSMFRGYFVPGILRLHVFNKSHTTIEGTDPPIYMKQSWGSELHMPVFDCNPYLHVWANARPS